MTLTPKEAIALQKILAEKVKIQTFNRPLRYIAGVDCAFSRDKKHCLAASVLWDMQTKSLVESTTAVGILDFPYIPGLLSFREAPTMMKALKSLKQTPDVVIIDGQGIAHPRGFGIACHVGIDMDLPTIGCAKSLLVGEYAAPSTTQGSHSHLTYKQNIIGKVLRTRDKVRPVFISVGHLMDLENAIKIILDCNIGFRLPEPTRLADRLVSQFKQQLEIA